ncbi:hypothetical protein JX265_007599 [Neoarthrinium moseri]|uniref:Uncharacterized protein n=1 Tax=Neoarthrinium moseri TaxID=1658444 RepID=A0A9P9WJR8_9PEZI|nr:hypothetical protein JX265_007599 [Neoarthrinium moseri]
MQALDYVPVGKDLEERVAHWGVYICNPTTQMCSIVGLNFSDATRENLILESAWPTEEGWKTGRSIREDEFRKSEVEGLRDIRVFCSFEEFILHGQLAIKHFMTTRPDDLDKLERFPNPEDVSLAGEYYVLLTKSCQQFAKHFMARMVEGLWTDEERPRDLNRFIDLEGDIARRNKDYDDSVEERKKDPDGWRSSVQVRKNLDRDSRLFCLEEMAMVISEAYKFSNTLTDWRRQVLRREANFRWDLPGTPGRIFTVCLELISRLIFRMFMVLVRLRGFFQKAPE